MRKVLWVLISAAILTACTSKTPIKGSIEGTNGKRLNMYLVKPHKLQEVAASFLGTIIDSAVVETDGSFVFTNLPEEIDSLLLEIVLHYPGQIPNQLETDDPVSANYMPVVWRKGEQLNISATLKSFQQSFTLENPSQANRALLKLKAIKLQAYKQFLQGKHWRVEDGSQLLEKEKALLNYQNELIRFAAETNHFLPAMVALRWVSPENDYERIPEFLNNQCDKWKVTHPANPWVHELCAQSQESKLPLLTGAVFPDAQLPLLSGDTISVYDSLGDKLTIVDLWASWCAPCRKENKEVLLPLWQTFKDKGLQIVGYGLESDRAAWEAAIKKDGAYRWIQASHLEGDVTPLLQTLRIQTIPANFILDASGKVLAKNLHGDDLTQYVRNFLEE